MDATTTAAAIIGRVRESVQGGVVIAPGEWLDLAFSLNALIGSENDLYAVLYHNAHIIQHNVIKAGGTASSAEAEMKASDDYMEMLKQKGKVEQIMEFIRVAKIRGSQADKEFGLDV